MDMNKTNFIAFRKDFAVAVKELEEKYGVNITIGSITYSADSFHTKMEVINGATTEDAEKIKFEQNLYGFNGLTIEDYGREFTINKEKFVLVGLKPRASINRFVIRNSKGKQYVCSATTLGL